MLKMNDTKKHDTTERNMRVFWGCAFTELSYYEHMRTCIKACLTMNVYI